MPTTCCVVECGNRGDRDVISFYRIPKPLNFEHKTELNELSKLRRDKWIEAIGREDLTESKLKYTRVCAKHFIKGKPSDLTDVENPDWVPSLLMGDGNEILEKEQLETGVARQKRFRKRRKLVNEHFEADQFEKSGYLKSTAVPTIFSHNNESLIRQVKKDDQKNKSVVVMCRTCLLLKEKQSSTIITSLVHGKTIKEMVLRLIPQIAETVNNNSYVCDSCVKCLCKCIEFIDNCLDFESKIRDGQLVYHSEDVLKSDDEDTDSDYEAKKSPVLLKQDENVCTIVTDQGIEKPPPEKKVIIKVLQTSKSSSSVLKKDVSNRISEQKNSTLVQKKKIPMRVKSIKKIPSAQSGIDEAPPTSEDAEIATVETFGSGDLKIASSTIDDAASKSESFVIEISGDAGEQKNDETEGPGEDSGETIKQKRATEKNSDKSTEDSLGIQNVDSPIAVRSSKRNRTRRKLDDCAEDEEIDAYISSENFELDDETKDDFKSTSPKRNRRRKDEDADYKVESTADLQEKCSTSKRISNRKLKKNSHERESSPELQVLHTSTRGTMRTYERKKKSVLVEEPALVKKSEISHVGIDFITQQSTDEISGDDCE